MRWDADRYGELLAIGGGKERMATLFDDPAFVAAAGLPTDADGRAATLARWHKAKTARFKDLVAAGELPPRPGITRIITAAVEAGWPVAVASTSAEESVRAVLNHAVPPGLPADTGFRRRRGAGQEAGSRDLPARRRPARHSTGPTRWSWRTRGTACSPRPARACACLVTVNGYTRGEAFDEAVLVVSELGDPGRPPIEVLADRGGMRPATT